MKNYYPRISRGITGFNTDITSTYNYLIKECPPPVGYLNWQRLGWSADEMAQWQDFKQRWDPLYELFINKKVTRTTQIKDDLLLIIKETRAYDHSHNLYNLISVNPNATVTDFELFHILLNTSLALTSHRIATDPGTKRVSIVLNKIGHLFHQLLVTSPDRKGRGKGEGVKDILVYKAITGINEVAPDFELFHYAGDVSRGLITITHKEENIGQKAWYIACIRNSRGKLGVQSFPVGFIII